MCCPFDSLNLHSNFDSKSTRLDYSPIIENPWEGLVASCDGILCFSIDECLAVLYNPSIKKVTKLPSIDLPREVGTTRYAFGYDPFIDNYKVVAVFSHYNNYEAKVKVHSYTLRTDSWKRIKNFPSRFSDPFGTSNSKHGIFMRGTVNWLTFSESTDSDAIVSLHLGMESYQEISLPNLSDGMLTLYVMRDCLCVFVISKDRNVKEEYFFTDVWLMKEYGNKESWIKLCRIPFFGKYDFHTDIVYISEDNNHVLSRNANFNWIIYNLKNNTTTINNSKTHDNLGWVKSKVYVESLISP
jgi:F-box interacting protein